VTRPASGAFGALASKLLAGAGFNLVLAPAAARAQAGRGRLRKARRQGRGVNLRRISAANCDKIVEAASNVGGVDISGSRVRHQQVSKIVDQPPETLHGGLDVNVPPVPG